MVAAGAPSYRYHDADNIANIVNAPSNASQGLVGNHGPTYSNNEAGVRTTSGGSSQFNGDWVRITIPIPDCYNPDSSHDFWSLRYKSGGGTANDTITFGVTARGGPVRLIFELTTCRPASLVAWR
jgi:hypothetical protein